MSAHRALICDGFWNSFINTHLFLNENITCTNIQSIKHGNETKPSQMFMPKSLNIIVMHMFANWISYKILDTQFLG
jgi:hypothetical protein